MFELDFPAQADLILGQAGDDSIHAGHGDNTVRGGGDDFLWSDGGADRRFGRGGADEIDVEGHACVARGGRGDDSIQGEGRVFGGAGDDLIVSLTSNPGSEIGETLVGGGGRDTILGHRHDDVIGGGRGRDEIATGEGEDTVFGSGSGSGSGGVGGADRILAGRGARELTGGDVFAFVRTSTSERPDLVSAVTDFAPGLDRLDLSDFFVSAALPLVWIGTGAFGDSPNEVRLDPARQELQIGGGQAIDGGSIRPPAFAVSLAGVTALSEADLILWPRGRAPDAVASPRRRRPAVGEGTRGKPWIDRPSRPR